MSRSFRNKRDYAYEKASAVFHLKDSTQKCRVGMTIGIDLGDIWSHYCTLSEDGEVIDRGHALAVLLAAILFIILVGRLN
jgi:hypothetical protein